MAKMIVRKPGYMFDKIWAPGEKFEFNGPKSTWFAPEGEEPRPPVNVDAVLNRPTLNSSPDEKDREIERLRQQLAEGQGKASPHPMAQQVPHGPVTAPVSQDERRREDEEARNHQANNPTLTPEQRQNATREESDRAFQEQQEAAKKAEVEKKAKEEHDRRAKEAAARK